MEYSNSYFFVKNSSLLTKGKGIGYGLLFDMTQPTSRCTVKSHRTK